MYENELRLCDLAVELGFESLWTVEHHFDDYTMCPDPVQWLSYMAGKHPNVLLGSGVIVLPWHDPLRVAEQVALLDHAVRRPHDPRHRPRVGPHRVRRASAST